MEGTILNANVGDSTKSRIKSLFNMMYKYAVAHDIADKDYASVMFANGNPIKRERAKKKIPFTDEEIIQLWDNKDTVPFVDMVLIGIYSGWRPQELAILKVADIDLEIGIMKSGLKTDAGKNRIVPIHSVIKPFRSVCQGQSAEILKKSGCVQFAADKAVDFVAHGFPAGGAEME